MSDASSKYLFILGAMVPTLAFAIASAIAFQTTTPEWAATEEVSADPDAPATTYVKMDEPIDLGLYQGRIRVSINLAFAVRLDTFQLLDLSSKVSKVQDSILAEITETVLDLAAEEKNSADLGPRLRQSLPQPLKEIVNRNLSSEDLPNPVDEVLILDMSVVPG